jgi:membrane associated rhomboid family serine protease
MFLPYHTDAPIYHWPKATVGLIAAIVVAYLATAGLEDEGAAWTLVRGDGLHPVQWLTSVFMHADLEHLIGNMIFLWAFGIVVEGKLGALPFLAVYLGIGVSQAALMQVVSLGGEQGYILGASAAIYGLLAVCLVWAPRNDLHCLFFGRIVPSQVDVPILWFAALYIGMEFVFVVLTGAAMSSALLHLTGALIGFGVGVVLLKSDFVDCEDWDLFAVLAGRQGLSDSEVKARRARAALVPQGRPAAPMKKKRKDAPAPTGEDPGPAATRRLRRHLEAGEALAAHAVYDRAVRTVAGWQPTGPDWIDLIKALLDARELTPAVAVMEDYLRRAPDPSPRVRLKLAQVLIRDQQRPAQALRVLAGAPEGSLPGPLEATRRQFIAEAERMREDGVLELEGEAW